MPQFGLLLPLVAVVVAAPQAPSNLPVSGENGEMGGIFGMGAGGSGGKGGLEALGGLLGGKGKCTFSLTPRTLTNC
jgi:hypothetical protein